jgi:tetratricopeptide (TPR) repeat protein
MEDIEIRRDGANAVTQVRFGSAVQFQRAVASKSGDLLQVYYNTGPSSDPSRNLSGERRVVGGNGFPQITITDDAISPSDLTKRKLTVRVSTPTPLKARAGRTKETLEIVLANLGPKVDSIPAAKTAVEEVRRYAIILQSSSDPGAQLRASIPSQFQSNEIFTSRRIADGKTLFDLNLGYFSTLADAEKAQKVLLKRFPNASVVPLNLEASAPAPPPENTEPSVSSSASPEVTLDAEKLFANAMAAKETGDLNAAVAALDALLNLPPNSYSRRAQKEVGILRLSQGDRERARSEFETFLKIYPVGKDSDEIRQFLINLPAKEEQKKPGRVVESSTSTTGSVSVFYYGGQSDTRTQDFTVALPTDSTISNIDQNQIQTNIDLNWRSRDADNDMRFVVRDSFTSNMLPRGKDVERLSALYFDERNLKTGLSVKVGRQSPIGGGVLYRFDGAQVGYKIAPKWRVNAVYGVPTDALLDSKRSFYGTWVDADALTQHLSGSAFINQQEIDGEIDRSAVGTELRYFNGGVAVSGQVDYDIKLDGLNTAGLQGSWQFPDNSVFNFLLDHRAVPLRSLGNALFYPDAALTTPARSIKDLLATTPIDVLRTRVNAVTPFQNQASLGYNTPISEKWQTGGNVNYTNVDAIPVVPGVFDNGAPSTGDLWSVGAMLIGSNLYSARDTHVFNLTLLTGPTYNATLLSYNNLTGVTEKLQLEPSLRLYTQSDNVGTQTNRVTPGMRVTYRAVQRVSVESELTYEVAETKNSSKTETSNRLFYYLGGRFDF